MKVKLLILSLLFTISLSAQDFWWWWDSDEDVPHLLLTTVTTTDNYAIPNFLVRGIAGGEININWGDGTDTTIVFTGSNQSIAKTFADIGTYEIKITGELNKIQYLYDYDDRLGGVIPALNELTSLTQFYCNDNQLTGNIPDLSSNTSLTTFRCYNNQLSGWEGGTVSATLGNFLAHDNQLTSETVDALLIAFSNAGRNSGQRILNLGGTNSPRTSASDDAVDNLVNNLGWTVNVNEPQYEMEAERYFASLETPLSNSAKTKINNFVAMLKDSLGIDSLAEKFDVMYLLANETSEAGLKNLVKRLHDATAVNSPTFTQWEGFAGNGTSSYLNSNYNPVSGAVVVQNINNSFGFYGKNFAINQSIMGSSAILNRNFEATRGSIDTALSMFNQHATNGVPGNRYADALNGFYISSRLNATGYSNYYNGSDKRDENANATNFNDQNIFLLCRNFQGSAGNYSTSQLSFVFIGSGLTADEVARLTNCVEAYLDELGVGVIE